MIPEYFESIEIRDYEACVSCRFCRRFKKINGFIFDAAAECHFNPPSGKIHTYKDHDSAFPIIAISEWCGCYEYIGDNEMLTIKQEQYDISQETKNRNKI